MRQQVRGHDAGSRCKYSSAQATAEQGQDVNNWLAYCDGRIRDEYPEYSCRHWGRSGWTLLHEALPHLPRKTFVVPGFMCPDLAAAVMGAGKQAIHIDSDQRTLHYEPGRLEEFLRQCDQADTVLLVDHTFGYPFCGISALRDRYPKLFIIEDCARALGSIVNGRPVGHEGDWTLLSLYKIVPGNDHGSVLLAGEQYPMRPGPVPGVTLRQRVAMFKPARAVYERLKRRRGDYPATRRDKIMPQWEAQFGTPNQLCLRRFAGYAQRLEDHVAQCRQAALSIRSALAGLDHVDFINEVAAGRSNAAFLSFVVSNGALRNELLARLHRRGVFLLRTWDSIPAFFQSLAATFPYGDSGSRRLADCVVHIPVWTFLNPRRLRSLVEELRSSLSEL